MMCKQVIEFLMDYLDDTLDQGIRAQFERHLGLCKDCVDFLITYRETIRIGRSSCEFCEDEEHPPIPEGLVRAILKATKEGGGQASPPAAN